MIRDSLVRTKAEKTTRRKSQKMATPCNAQDPAVIADTKSRILASPKHRKHTATEPVAKIPSKKRESVTGKEKWPKKIGTKPHLRETVLPMGKNTNTQTAEEDHARRGAPEIHKGQKPRRALTAEAEPTAKTSRSRHITATIMRRNHWWNMAMHAVG